MNKKVFFIKPHSMVDLITNSSTELFIIDLSKVTEFLNEVFKELIMKSNYCGESEICKLSEYRNSDEYIIPDDIDINNTYVCEIDNHDVFLLSFIEKYFQPIELDYNEYEADE